MTKIIRMIMCVLMTAALVSCSDKRGDEEAIDNGNKILSDIAFDNGEENCRVYIKENGKDVPYLVLSSDYNGNCLLLREYLLTEKRIYNKALGHTPSYYENSVIDVFLNNEFNDCFNKYTYDKILNSQIEITTSDSIGVGGKETTRIQRRIFLLSYTELNGGSSRTNLKEGSPLKYFEKEENRIAKFEDGKFGSWWLRTPNTGERLVVSGVAEDGIVGIGGINGANGGEYRNGVRPAFCLPNDTIITKKYEGGYERYILGSGDNN